MSRRTSPDPDVAEVRRLLAPERTTPQPPGEDATMPAPTRADLAEAAAIADGAGRLAAMVDEQPDPGPARIERDPIDAALLQDAAATLQILDRAPTGPTATLTMPLGRLVDADGTETLLGEALVHVELIPAGVLDWLSPDPDPDTPAVRVTVEHRLTDDGAAAIRSLATLLPAVGGENR
jgi:hypothetical protein